MLTPDLRATAEALVARYPVGRSALLPLLHLVQSQEGYVNEDGIAECAQLLGLTKAEVGAVATFYTMYKRAPMGRHLVSVCTNFSCKVRGGQEVYERLSQRLGVGHNGTTDDGAITLEHAECLGNCEGAPVVTVDYLNYECLSPDDAEALVAAVAKGEVPRPTRGFPSAGIRQTSHRLAGAGPLDADPEGRSSLVDTAGASAPPPTAAEPAPAAAEAPEERTEDRAEAPGQDPDGDKGLVTEAKELVSAAREHLPSWLGGSSHAEPDSGEETEVSTAPEGDQGAERRAEAHAAEVDVERSTGADSDEVESESGYSSREMPTSAQDSDDDYPSGDPRGDDLEPAQPAGDRDRSRLLGPDGPESEPRSDELGDKSDPGSDSATDAGTDPGTDTPTDPGASDRG